MNARPIFSTLIIGGGLLSVYGFQQKSLLLLGTGLAAIGSGIIYLGINTIRQRESIIQNDSGKIASYHGFNYIIISIVLVLIGSVLFSGGFVNLACLKKPAYQSLSEHPGIILLTAGLISMAFGGQKFFGFVKQKRSCLFLPGNFPGHGLGLLLILAGILLSGIRLLEIISLISYQVLSLSFTNLVRKPALPNPARLL